MSWGVANRGKPDRGRIKAWLCLALLMVVLLSSWYPIGRFLGFFPLYNMNDLSRLIEAELPRGTDKSKAVSFLDAHRIEHGDYEIKSSDSPQFLWESEWMSCPPGGGLMRGQIRGNVTYLVLGTENFELVFVFDKAKKLVNYRIEKWATGPI
jgi:hypothetical protein